MKGVLAAVLSLALVAMMTPLAGCGQSGAAASGSAAAGSAATTQITDMLGRSVTVPTDVERVIGIGSSSLRLICYLGQQDKVVGVEASEQEDNVECPYRHINHALFASLPVIGEGGSNGTTPNDEAIIQAAPDVIFASVDADTADALSSKTGIPVVCLTLSDTLFDPVFYNNVQLVGSILGASDRASSVVSYIQGIQQDLDSRTQAAAAADPETAYAAGISYRGGHGFDGTQAGFPPFDSTHVTNIADGLGTDGAFTIDLEAVSSAQPDYVFVDCGNLQMVQDDYNANPSYYQALDAFNDGNVYSLIPYRFYATNVGLALADCYQVGKTVYPQAFADVDPTAKLDEISTFLLGAPLASDLAAAGYTYQQLQF
jgi:iron complex transport system substrate-binding protein